jgi:indolepyruvate ferredoxin oxidoreductase alpha subunit
MTGHQDHPATGVTIASQPTAKLDLEALVKAVGIKNVRVVDPLKLEELRTALEEELARREPSVIICKRPCALLGKTPVKERYYVDNELCKGCKLCVKIGCTVYISWMKKSWPL